MELYLYYNCLIYVNSLRKEIVKHMQKILPKELADEIMQNKTAMYRVAYSITNNDADAQDAVGDAIVKAFEHLYQIKKKKSVKAWLMQIVVNSAKNIVKKQSRLKLVESEMEIIENSEVFEMDTMWPVIMELPEKSREVVVLYYYEQFTTKEISKMLAISEGTVKSRLSRSREKLIKLLY